MPERSPLGDIQEMTARQLAQALLAVPNPDTPVAVTVYTADGRWGLPSALRMLVREGEDPGLVFQEPEGRHYVDLTAIIQSGAPDDRLGRPRWIPEFPAAGAAMSTQWTVVTEADQVTEEILSAAEQVFEGWFATDERIDWQNFIDRLDGAELKDGTTLDLGDNTGSGAIKKIKRHIHDYRKL